MKTILCGLVLLTFVGFSTADTSYVPIERQEHGSSTAYLSDIRERGKIAASVATKWEKNNPDKMITCLSVQINTTSEVLGLWITYMSRVAEKQDMPSISTNGAVTNLKLPGGVQHLGEGVLFFKSVESTFATRLVQFMNMNQDFVISAICPNIVRQNRISPSGYDQPAKERNPHSDYGAPNGYYVIVRNKK